MMSLSYSDDPGRLRIENLTGFFDGWPTHPDPQAHLEILRSSHTVWLALDGERCVGFVNALSDGVFYAFVPLLEVLPEYRGRGIGSELVRRMVLSLGEMYAVDLVCDEGAARFYEAHGFSRATGMVKRNYSRQDPSH